MHTAKLTKSLIVTMVAFTLSGCVDADLTREITSAKGREDASHVVAIVDSSASVQRAMQPLYLCVPEKVSCYTTAGPAILRVVEQEEDRIADLAAEAENSCLADVVSLYDNSLGAYRDAGRAAVKGDPEGVERAISRSTKYEIEYSKKLGDCGFVDEQRAQQYSAINSAFWDLVAISDEIFNCRDRRKCIIANSRRLEMKAHQGIALLDEYIRELEDAPACVVAAMGKVREAFRAIEEMAIAIQEGDAAVAREQGKRAGQLGVTAQEDFAACMTPLVQ